MPEKIGESERKGANHGKEKVCYTELGADTHQGIHRRGYDRGDDDLSGEQLRGGVWFTGYVYMVTKGGRQNV